MGLVLCPTPLELEVSDHFPRPESLRIGGVAASIGSRRLNAWSEWSAAVTGVEATLDGDYTIQLDLAAEAPGGEAYELQVTRDGATARAASLEGLRNALSTFLQLLLNEQLPECGVRDEPLLRTRGFMLDISRDKVPTMETLRMLVRLLALLKYNQLQLYIEHTFAFRDHNAVWGLASPLNHAEIKELDAYCALLGIELVPNLNSLGHMERWLRHPEYRRLAECPEGITLPNGRVLEHGTTLVPGPEANAFLEGLYAEYLPLFTSGQFNCGLDEPWELGMGRSRDRSEREGKQSIYLEHLRDVGQLSEKFGKRPQFWADIVLQSPESVKQLPQSTTGLIWGYEADHPFDDQARRFAEQGLPYLLCPGTGAWNSIGGRWPTARQNIMIAVEAARAHGAEGLLLTEWGDNGHHHPLSTILPALLLNAAACWNPANVCDIAEGIDRLAVGDVCEQAGRAIVELGSIWDAVPKPVFNSSVLFRVLLGSDTVRRKVLEGVSVDSLREILERLNGVRHLLRDAQPKRFGGQIVVRELENAANLLEVATRRGLRDVEGTDDARLAGDLAVAIGEFERLWLERNRIGGLHESSARLRQAGSGRDMIL